jgi:hypothetical protein
MDIRRPVAYVEHRTMPPLDRARFTAFSILAAVAGLAAVGVAMLARAGICLHRLGWLGSDDHAMMPGMPGMAMPGMSADGSMPPGAICPAMLYASAVAAVLCLFALLSLIAMRPRASAVAIAAARIVLALRLGPLTALLCLGGAVPLTLATAMDGMLIGPAPLVGGLLLFVAAALGALALIGIARTVMAFACRLAVALATVFRLLLPGANAPWAPWHEPLLVSAGVGIARRRPSRAPPVR